MVELVFLKDFVIVLAAASAVGLLSHQLRLPSVVGLLVTGVLIGPSALALIDDLHQVEVLAEIGVVALLFSVGLEFSLPRLRRIGAAVFFGGALQVFVTLGAVAGIALALGAQPGRAIFFGCLVALSSTAVVLKLYDDRREIGTPHGTQVLGMLLFQDLLLIPMMVMVPLLGGTAGASTGAVVGRLGIGVAVIGLVALSARWLMPRLLYLLVRTRAREVFLLGTLLIGLGLAWLTESLGLSAALGAFLAGILISESEYSHQVVADVLPFKHVFNSFFFISIGMLLDLRVVAARPGMVLALALGVILLKAPVAAAAVAVQRLPVRTSVLAGLGVAQVGEFSFLLAGAGLAHGLLAGDEYQLFIAAALLSLLATPLLIATAPRAAEGLRALIPRGWAFRAEVEAAASTGLEDHVVIVGFGLGGRNLARVLRKARIGYVAVELNGRTVRAARAEGEPIVFGDVTQREILELAAVERARIVLFAISDPGALPRAIRQVRELAPNTHIVVRARALAELEALYAAGADEVVAEEFETSIELFSRVLLRYHVPRNVIDAEGAILRGDLYRAFRGGETRGGLTERAMEILAAGTTAVFFVEEEHAAVGQTIRELDLRGQTGATVIAVVRGEEPRLNPSPDLRLAAGDSVVLVGAHAEMRGAFDRLEGGPGEAPG